MNSGMRRRLLRKRRSGRRKGLLSRWLKSNLKRKEGQGKWSQRSRQLTDAFEEEMVRKYTLTLVQFSFFGLVSGTTGWLFKHRGRWRSERQLWRTQTSNDTRAAVCAILRPEIYFHKVFLARPNPSEPTRPGARVLQAALKKKKKKS